MEQRWSGASWKIVVRSGKVKRDSIVRCGREGLIGKSSEAVRHSGDWKLECGGNRVI